MVKNLWKHFFFRCGFCLLCLLKLRFHESEETIMFSIAKVPEKTNCQAPSWLPPGFKAGPFSKKAGNAAGVCWAERQTDGVVERWLEKLSHWITAAASRERSHSPWLRSHLCQVQVQQCADKDWALRVQTLTAVLHPTRSLLSRKDWMQK